MKRALGAGAGHIHWANGFHGSNGIRREGELGLVNSMGLRNSWGRLVAGEVCHPQARGRTHLMVIQRLPADGGGFIVVDGNKEASLPWFQLMNSSSEEGRLKHI